MNDRRRKSRAPHSETPKLYIAAPRKDGSLQRRTVQLVDVSDWGIGIESRMPMVVGSMLFVWGEALPAAADLKTKRKATVIHCRVAGEGLYRTGCAFENAPPRADRGPAPRIESSFIDYYEILQISPNADSETIHRVYRLMAQRFHPDNPDTGSSSSFQEVLQAYRVLSDLEQRAAYDVSYHASRSLRWKIFDRPESAQGVEAEKRKRAGVLHALYAKRMAEPDGKGIVVREFEDLLGCPSEHLSFTLWYLRRKEMISRTDNGRYEISAEGVDEAERLRSAGETPERLRELPAATGETAS